MEIIINKTSKLLSLISEKIPFEIWIYVDKEQKLGIKTSFSGSDLSFINVDRNESVALDDILVEEKVDRIHITLPFNLDGLSKQYGFYDFKQPLTSYCKSRIKSVCLSYDGYKFSCTSFGLISPTEDKIIKTILNGRK